MLAKKLGFHIYIVTQNIILAMISKNGLIENDYV